MLTITIDHARCQRDQLCRKVCPSALFQNDAENFPVVPGETTKNCIRCGHCVAVCPHDAITHSAVPLADSPLINPEWTIPVDRLDQLQKRRRSIRQYKADPVPDDTIKAMLEAARFAPSAINQQPVNWIILQKPGTVKTIAGLIVEGLRKTRDQNPHMAYFIDCWDKGTDVILRGAPHVAIAHASARWAWAAQDCLIALTWFDLAAQARGIGTCWAGILMHAAADHPPLLEALGVPRGQVIHGALMFGFPELTFRRIPPRKPSKITWK